MIFLIYENLSVRILVVVASFHSDLQMKSDHARLWPFRSDTLRKNLRAR